MSEQYKLVPVEPTIEMTNIGFDCLSERGVEWHDSSDVAYAYKAMIAAAPTQPSPAESDNSEDKWRDLALQFDGHRMQAIGWLKVAAERLPDHVAAPIKEFLKAPPIPGQKVLEDRIASISTAESDKEAPINGASDFEIAEAIETLQWTGVPIGHKAILQSAIFALKSRTKKDI